MSGKRGGTQTEVGGDEGGKEKRKRQGRKPSVLWQDATAIPSR